MTKVYRDVAGPCLAPAGSVLAVGAFDGLHLGHQALLAQVRARAQTLAAVPAAVSFEPLPRAFFSPQPLPRLASMREKIQGLSQAGMARVLLLRFNQALTAMSAHDFVRRVLVERMGVRELWVGEQFRFGHRRAGDFALLERMGAELGFAACAMDAVAAAGQRVSSSAIRERLVSGDFGGAAELLGREFSMSGRVVRGEQLGRTLGYPTANLRLGRRVSPVQGIFAVRVDIDGGAQDVPGVASLGWRPTVNALVEPLLESHLFDFDGDLYGRHIRVRFVEKLRDELKFEHLDALRAQMDIDAAQARQCLDMPVSG